MLFNCSDLRIPSEILLGRRRMPLAAWEKAWRATEGMSRSMSSSSKPAIGMVRREAMGRRRGKEMRICAELQRVLLYRLNNAYVSCCRSRRRQKLQPLPTAVQVSKTFSFLQRLNQTLVCNISDSARPLKFNVHRGRNWRKSEELMMTWEVWGGYIPIDFQKCQLKTCFICCAFCSISFQKSSNFSQNSLIFKTFKHLFSSIEGVWWSNKKLMNSEHTENVFHVSNSGFLKT